MCSMSRRHEYTGMRKPQLRQRSFEGHAREKAAQRCMALSFESRLQSWHLRSGSVLAAAAAAACCCALEILGAGGGAGSSSSSRFCPAAACSSAASLRNESGARVVALCQVRRGGRLFTAQSQ